MKQLEDRLKGALYGFALGDALGVGTEFMTRREARTYYPDGCRTFDMIVRDAHRSQWKPGEWTNDTEIVVRLLDTVLSDGGFSITSLARRFKAWYDEAAIDMSPVFRAVLTQPDWTSNPVTVAHRVWKQSGLSEASNEAIQRALVSALTSSPDDLMEHTRKLVLSTNDDTRCVTSTMIIARMMHTLLHEGREASLEELMALCNRFDSRTAPFLRMAAAGDIEALDLDDEDTQQWTRKAMAAALWGLWHSHSADEAIYMVIDQGGDADSNAALAGALAGLKYGYGALPAEKEKIIGRDRLDDLAARLAQWHSSDS